VTVTYQVRSGAEDDFQEAVQFLGWSRRRTGAVRWTVLLRAESPGRFVEMFVVANWDEYRRQHSRHTVADAAMADRLRAFLRAGTKPAVPCRDNRPGSAGVLVRAARSNPTMGQANRARPSLPAKAAKRSSCGLLIAAPDVFAPVMGWASWAGHPQAGEGSV
jgi:transmembrane secretion effector